jgi:hypothetical protein
MKAKTKTYPTSLLFSQISNQLKHSANNKTRKQNPASSVKSSFTDM